MDFQPLIEDVIQTTKLDQGIIAVMLTVIGGIIVKLIDKSSKKDHSAIVDAISLRSQIMDEIGALSKRVDDLTKEVDSWREKYYEQVEINLQQKHKIKYLEDKLDELTRRNEIGDLYFESGDGP